MNEDLTREEVHEAADRIVEELLEQAGLTGPPVDAVALAERHLGLGLHPDGARGRGPRRRSVRGEPATAPESSPEERQWLAARALGAHLTPTLLRRLGVETEGGRASGGASLANLLAEHLLLPLGWFADDASEHDHDVLELKARYATATVEVIAFRLLDLSEPCIITVVDNDHVHKRRSNAFQVRRELAPAEQQCQRYVTQYSRPHVVRRGGWTVQGWPIHKPDWKREILRSVVSSEG
jgi:hypothetical protein